MSVHPLVQQFYDRIWNAGDENVAALLTPEFSFRGSLGTTTRGHAEFLDYVRSVRCALANYHCEILDCVTEFPLAFARLCFSGRHVGPFRGFPASGKSVEWHGAALFRLSDGRIQDLWVLGDLAALDQQLLSNSGG
jgi:steroid delta-isomerase-like uncharacterized protein